MTTVLKIALAAGFVAILAASAHAQMGGSSTGSGTTTTPGIAPATPAPSGTTGIGPSMSSPSIGPSTQPGIPGAVSPSNPNAAWRPSTPNIGGAPVVGQPGTPPMLQPNQPPCLSATTC